MVALAFLAELIIVLSLTLAAVSKLLRLKETTEQFVQLGSPKALALPAVAIVSGLELIVSWAILFPTTRVPALYSSLVMLVLYTMLLGFYSFGERDVSCACFGNFADSNVGPKTILRNFIFMACSLLALVFGSYDSIAYSLERLESGTWSVAVILSSVVLSIVAIIISLLSMRTIGLLRKELGLSDQEPDEQSLVAHLVGKQIPKTPLQTRSGDSRTVERIRTDDKPLLLLLTSPNCRHCDQLKRELKDLRAYSSSNLQIVEVIDTGASSMDHLRLPDKNLDILIDPSGKFGTLLNIPGTPVGLLVLSSENTIHQASLGPARTVELAQMVLADPD